MEVTALEAEEAEEAEQAEEVVEAVRLLGTRKILQLSSRLKTDSLSTDSSLFQTAGRQR